MRLSLAILKTRFRCGSLKSLTSPHAVTRWLILQKARRHTVVVLRPLAGARFQVLFHSPRGVLFTFPSRYWFAIGHRRVFSLGGWSPLLPAGFHLPGGTRVRPSRGMGVRVRGSHPLRPAFPCRSAPASLSNRAPGSRPRARAARNPRWESPWGCPTHRVWAGALSLAATRAISVDFSSSGYLDVSVPRVASLRPMRSGGGGGLWGPPGFPIRRPSDRCACAAPRGFSQLAASFIGFQCQGIHRVPLTSSSLDVR